MKTRVHSPEELRSSLACGPVLEKNETISMQCKSHTDGGEENLRGGEVVRLVSTTGHGHDTCLRFFFFS